MPSMIIINHFSINLVLVKLDAFWSYLRGSEHKIFSINFQLIAIVLFKTKMGQLINVLLQTARLNTPLLCPSPHPICVSVCVCPEGLCSCSCRVRA